MTYVDSTEAEFEAEYAQVNKYIDEYTDVMTQIEAKSRLKEDNADNVSVVAGSGISSKYRLPKLELQKLTGDVKVRLGFWSPFSSIHHGKKNSDQEKFQCLIQSTVLKTFAREVVASFPASDWNYPKVVDYIKSRFGNEDVLREVYVRDLL